MRVFKTILLSLLSIVALLLIIAMFVRKDYAVAREITINKPKQQIFDYIKYLKNQDNFSKWATMDPNMKKDYKGTDGTVGFISAWDSKMDDVGKGEQEIKKITDGERLDFELRFIEPFESKAQAYMTTEAVDSTQTNVKWGFTGRMNYPMNLMLVFMDMDEMIGKDLDTGLSNLKKTLEK